MSQLRQLLRTGMLTIAWIAVVPCLLVLLAVLVPVIPWVRIYAFDLVPNYAPWLLLTSLAGITIGIAAHAAMRTTSTRSLIAVASIAAIAAAVIITHFLYVAETNGVQVDLTRTLSLRKTSDAAGPDAVRLYAKPQGEPLWVDIYRPRGVAPGARSPVLMFVHGGGFVEGTRRMGAANMRGYADRGWTVLSIDYRLARPGRPTWNLAVRDVRCALAWTAAHANELELDMRKLTLSGASAGGHLAMAAAYAPDAAAGDTGCGAHIPKVAAIVAKAPLIDVLGSWDHVSELSDKQHSYLSLYVGGSPAQYPERYAAIDLRRYDRPGNPPTLIVGGAQDNLLPPAGAQMFTRKAQAAGNAVRLVLFPYSGHDFNTTFDSITNQAMRQIIMQFMAAYRLAPGEAPPLPKR